jgi:hypothetical protein
MTVKSDRFTRGIILKADDVAIESVEGALKVGLTSKELHAYLDGALRTVATLDQSQVFTNKTIDADLNTITDLEVDNLKAGVLNTSSSLAGATDAQVPSALAVKTITDAEAAARAAADTSLQTQIDTINADLGDDVEGPASATDNAITRFDGVTGKLLQNSSATIDDSGNMVVPGSVTAGSLLVDSFTINGSLISSSTGSSINLNNGDFFVTATDNIFFGSSTFIGADSNIVGANQTIPAPTSKTINLTNPSLSSIDMITPSNVVSSGQEVILVNRTGSPVTINNETGATATSRIETGSAYPFTLLANESCLLVYTSGNRWRIVGARNASSIYFAPTVSTTSLDVQAAIEEVQTDANTANAAISGHLSDATDAHDASAISNIPSGNLAATDQQAVNNELQSDIDTRVAGPASATDNTLPRFDGTTGKLVQGSSIVVSDANAMSGLTQLTVDDVTINGSVISSSAQLALDSGPGTPTVYISGIDNDGVHGETVLEDTSLTGSNAVLDATAYSTILLTNSGLVSIASITPQLSNQKLTLSNKTGNPITIINDSGIYGILTGTGGDLVLNDNQSISLFHETNVDSRWNIVGGTGTGSGGGGTSDPDALLIQNFDDVTLGDFTQSGAALETVNTLHGAQSLKFVHDSVSTKYLEQTVAVDPKFRGVNITASLTVLSSASDGNLTFVVTDVTNSTTLTTQNIATNSQSISSLTRTNLSTTVSGFSNTAINTLEIGMLVTGTGIPAGTFITAISTTANSITLSQAATATSAAATMRFSDLSKTVQLGFKIPASCGSIKYRINALPEANAPETYIDDVQLKNFFLGTSVQGQSEIEVPVITTQSSLVTSVSTASGALITGAATSTSGSDIYTYNSGTGTYTMLVTASVSISASMLFAAGGGVIAAIRKNSVTLADDVTVTVGASANAAWSGILQAGDTFDCLNGGGSTATSAKMNVLATAYSTSSFTTTDIVPARAVLGNSTLNIPTVTEWTSYTPTFTGFGTPTNVEAQWRQNGENHEYRVKFTSGTSTAVEARVGLANGATSANTSKIPSIQLAGYMHRSFATTQQYGVLIEPSVSYFTFDVQGTVAGLSKVNGNSIVTSGEVLSFTASVPVSGLSATEEVVVSGTQSALVEEADSYLKINTGNAFGSTGTRIRRFTTVVANQGDDILYQDSATAGSSFTVQESGVYSINYTDIFTANGLFGLSKNASSLTTNLSSLAATEVLTTSTAAANISNQVSWTGYLAAGDIVRPHTDTLTENASTGLVRFIMTKQGSLKVATVNADQKITIPTSELRFEGASARGAVATGIVKFDTLAKIRGDAFTVTNTANDGTYVTMTKAGKLSVSSSLFLSTATAATFAITKNQSVLTAFPSSSSEILSNVNFGNIAGAATVNSASWTGDVQVGDIIRIASGTSPSAGIYNNFSLSFQEQSVQVSVSNTLPQFSESDSSVRVFTSNGFGSTATKIRRFSNVVQNLGTDIVYADSATNGASFTVQSSGNYAITYTDIKSAAGTGYIGITKNASNLTLGVNSITSGDEALAITSIDNVTNVTAVSWSGYLVQGDVIRAHSTGDMGAGGVGTAFAISKVGKPNVTGVDVTPFIEIPQPESQVIRLTAGSAAVNTDITNFTVASNTNNGIVSYTTSNGRITALRRCTINTTFDARSLVAGDFYGVIQKNGTTVVAQFENNVGGAGYSTQASYTDILEVGDYLTYETSGQGNTNSTVSFTATALSDQILTAPQTFSTDTAALQYASSATYTLSTLTNAPVGTYITFTYAINSNTRTQTTTRPTQTDADMNANGMLIYTRAYNAASTAAQPVVFAIQIGKGLKGKSLDLYKSSGKTTGGNIDHLYNPTATQEIGLGYKDYNEVTGILIVDAGVCFSTATTARNLAFSDLSSTTNGYLVINASVSPALCGLGLNRVAARVVQSSGQAVPTGTNTTITWDSAKTYDTTGSFNTATGVYTAPETGYYQLNAVITSAETAVSTHSLLVYKNGVYYCEQKLVIQAAVSASYSNVITDVIQLNKGDTLYLMKNQNSGVTRNLTASAQQNFCSIAKISI